MKNPFRFIDREAAIEAERPEYDARQRRGEVADAVALAIQMEYPDFEVGRVAHSIAGPLGGESSRFMIVERVDGQLRKFIVNVYAYGVMADGQS